MAPSPKPMRLNPTPLPAAVSTGADMSASTTMRVGGETVEPVEGVSRGTEPASRRVYTHFPDFQMNPAAFILEHNKPRYGDVTLRNGLFVSPTLYPRGKQGFVLCEGDLRLKIHHAQRAAIVDAMERVPFVHPQEKAIQVEAKAREGCDPRLRLEAERLLESRNSFGPLPAGTKAKVLSYMDAPTLDKWDEVHGTVMDGGDARRRATLWQWWVATDSTAPRCGPRINLKGEIYAEWERIPSPADMILLLREATMAVVAPGFEREA